MPTQEDIQRVVQLIAEKFRPQKIILFGSRAYGTPRPDSDADLLIVLPFDCSPYRMTVNILNAIGDTRGFDIVPRTPEHVRTWYTHGDPMIREALDKGRVLFTAAEAAA